MNVHDDEEDRDTERMRIEPAQRGALVISERAAKRIAERVFDESPRGVHHPKVAVQALDERGVELRSEFGIDYPDEPLSSVLAEVRDHVSTRVLAALGRPVRVLDLVVDDLVPAPAARRAS